MDQGNTDDRPDIAERVLRYFRENPTAMDSVEGIARFWIHENRGVVESCLAHLHTQGLLERRTIAGTQFYSLAKGPVRLQDARPHPASGTEIFPARSHGRILVVDDEPGVRKFLVDALTEAGHTVAAADDGGRAVEMFRASSFDLVVTDVVMPGVSGIGVLKAVKEHNPSTDVLVVTGHANLETALEALRHGAYDLIRKPIADLEVLHGVIARALERQRLSEENRLLVENVQARNRELKETVTRLAAINEIGAATTGVLDVEEIYALLVKVVAQHLKARRVSVLVTEPGSDTMSLVASLGVAEKEALTEKVRIGEGIAGRVAAAGSPLLVEDIEKTELKHLRPGGRYKTPSFMISPLEISYPIRYKRRRLGVINVSDKHSGDPFNEQDLEFLSTLGAQMAVAIENAWLVKEMEEGYLVALVGLIAATEDLRPQTRGHSKRVTTMATAVARAMGMEESRIEVLKRAVALHAVGRLSSLTEAEAKSKGWDQDAILATERGLAGIGSLRSAREIIQHSADPFGTAPVMLGTKQTDISVEAQILGVCEAYVRLTQEGAGEAKRSRGVLDELRRKAGNEYAPDVVQALCRVVETGA